MKRLTLATLALLAAVPATARADILWDLVNDAGSGGDYGAVSQFTGVSLTNDNNCGPLNTLTCGTILASSENAAVDVYGNDYNNGGNNGGSGSLGAYNMGALSEKGLGLCFVGSSGVPNGCLSSSPPFKEVDISASTGPLFLDLTGVQNSGGLNRIWIASTQINEGWEIYGSTTGTAGSPLTGTYVLLCSGAGSNSAFVDISTCGVDPTVTYRFLRFNSVNFGDFSVQALRFNSIVPEPGTMSLLATGLVALAGAGFIRRRKKN